MGGECRDWGCYKGPILLLWFVFIVVPCTFMVLPAPGCSLFGAVCDDLFRKTPGWRQDFLPGGWGGLCVSHRWT